MKNIASIRIEKQLTQADMARMLNMSVSGYNMYENGIRRIPKNKALHIAKILELNIEECFTPTTFTIVKTKSNKDKKKMNSLHTNIY